MKAFVLLLSAVILLAACETQSRRTETAAPTQPTVAEASSAELNSDSASGANLAAVAHQPQVDTSASKLGTEKTGGIVAKGAKLISSSDCTACHKERELLVGPAYTAVAEKYPLNDANVTMLANKIIQGGKGNWGQVPMTPHPDVPVEDAKEMVRYILALK